MAGRWCKLIHIYIHMTIHSYPKIYNVGHVFVKDIFSDTVLIQEKVDGSQFSFKKDECGQVFCKSKNKIIDGDIQKIFAKAYNWVQTNSHLLKPGWTYRGEALYKPKHNTLEYGRAPEAGFILFDIDRGICDYLTQYEVHVEAKRLGLEVVPSYRYEVIKDPSTILGLLDQTSFLGGCKIEGIVIKNYHQMNKFGQTLMAKHVSESFKEKHSNNKTFKEGKNFLDLLAEDYRTEARWHKALQHLRDEGKLENSPSDIGLLMKEITRDVLEECKEEISEQLFNKFWKRISRGLTLGFEGWYKTKLLQNQFEKE